MNHMIYAMALFFRLFAHAEDPDIDEPYKPPVGHVLGKGTLLIHYIHVTEVDNKVYFKLPAP